MFSSGKWLFYQKSPCSQLITIRFGNQGSAQAQNLRDSGIANENIIIANREDSYAASAKAKGFNVEHDLGKVAEVADGIDVHYA